MAMNTSGQNKITIQFPDELANDGDHTAFNISLHEISTADGDKIKPPRHGVTAIVGGNNAGKSTFLLDLWTLLSHPTYSVYKPRLIKEVNIIRDGTDSDLFAWLKKNVPWSGMQSRCGFLNPNGVTTTVSEVQKFCKKENPLRSLSQIANFIVQRGDLHKRLEVVKAVSQRDNALSPPTNPIHHLQDDPELLERIQDFSERIFRQKLTLDRLGGKAQLRVGIPNIEAPKVDRITPEYTKAMGELESLDSQGDGIKSLMGLLMPLATSPCRIMLIDEPEVFLHPPQAKMVGKILGEIAASREVQVFLATHDRNMLVGLLESPCPVAVVRLDRRTDRTAVHQLEHEMVRELWDEPALRYSNVLDGLFHRAVVLAESDSDCRFFAASLDGSKKLPFPAGDIQFVPVGGKDGFTRVIKGLRSVSVPTVTVADLDVLNDLKKTRTLVEAMGGDWNDFEEGYKASTKQFRTPRTSKTRAQVFELAKRVLSEDPDKLYDKEVESILLTAIRADRSPWQDLKEYGLRAFKGGKAVEAANQLLDGLEDIGIVLVREGELESLAPLVTRRKGPEWLAEALRTQSFLDERAQEHIARVINAVEKRLSA